jgi:trimeric autotransporter adhesin
MKTFRTISLLFILMLAFGAVAASAQVSVTATAGNTGPTGYATLKDAFDAVNLGTHQGAVTISITANTTEPANTSAVLNSSGAGGATYSSVLIRPTVDGVSITGTGGTGAACGGKGLIELNGADNVTIDGDNPNTSGTNRNLTITDTCTATYAQAIRIALNTTDVTSADNDTIKNLNIIGSAPGRNISTATSSTGTEGTTAGIYVSGAAATATTTPTAIASNTTTIGAGATANNLTISNNSIISAARGITINGAATTNFPGLLVNNNNVGNPTAGAVDQVYVQGISAQGSTNGVISGNTVYVESFAAATTTTSNLLIGIGLGNVNAAGAGFTVEKNKINRFFNASTAGYSATGIYIGAGSTQTIRNNFVSGGSDVANGNFSLSYGVFGIRAATGTGHLIYHNSVNLYGVLGGTGQGFSAAFVAGSSATTGMDVRNNIFADTQSGGSTTSVYVSIFFASGLTSAFNLTLNNNAYYQGGTVTINGIAQVGTTTVSLYQAANFDPTATTPATNLRAYTSTLNAAGTNDNASFASAAAAPFTSNSDLHIPNGTVTKLESGGTPVGVADDIGSQARNATTPDIGADEFNGVTPFNNDIAATAFVSPLSGGSVAANVSFTPQASFTNNGLVTQTNVPVRYIIINASSVVVYNDLQTIASIAPGATVTVTFSSVSLPAGSYTIQALAQSPGDQNPANDQINGTLSSVPPLNGGYTVGTGGNYTSLTNPGGIFDALNSSGASGNIVINITTNLTGETGAISLNELAGGSTVTIKPSGAARTITGAPTAALIALNGADNVTIDGSLSGGTDRSLTISFTSGTAAVSLGSGTNGAQNDTVKNVNIVGYSPTAALVGIASGANAVGSAATAFNNNDRIQNNSIQGVIFGITSLGQTAALKNTGTVITQNVMTGTGTSRVGRVGIYAIYDDGGQFTQNTISGISSAESADAIGMAIGAQAVSATTITSFEVSNALVARNYIGSVVQTNTYSAVGILMGASTTGINLVANNMVTGVNGNGDVGDFEAGILIANAAGGTQRIYHNSVSLTGSRGATPTDMYGAFALAIFGTDQPVDIRDNILYNTQTQAGGSATGNSYALGIGYATFANLTSNYNDLYVNGAQGKIGLTGGLVNTAGTDRTALSDLQGATAQDANSVSVAPQFTSATDLHLQFTSLLLNAGTPVGLSNDFDGDPRPSGAGPEIGADEIVQATAGVIAGGTYYNAIFASNNTLGGAVTITGQLTVTGISNAGANIVELGCGAVVNNAGNSSYVNGTVRKDFCAPGLFVFPVGTATNTEDGTEGVVGNYTPVTANVTAVSIVPSSLDVTSIDATLYPMDPLRSVSRNWNLLETGDLTADLSFTYTAADVAGNEADYRVYRRDTGPLQAMCAAPCVNTATHTAGPVVGVTTFSRWSVGEAAQPTAASSNIGGRVTTASGNGIRNAAIVLSGGSLDHAIVVKTGSLGYYQFTDLPSGQSYVMTIVSKRFTFSQATQVINLIESRDDVNFTADPQPDMTNQQNGSENKDGDKP